MGVVRSMVCGVAVGGEDSLVMLLSLLHWDGMMRRGFGGDLMR